MKKILITGVAGFIGHHLSYKLFENGYDVVGIDNINNYYNPKLKLLRLEDLEIDTTQIKYNQAVQGKIKFLKIDLIDKYNIQELFKREKFDYVINLAAQAGVRYSLLNPQAYIDSNITGFLNILEACRNYPVKHLIFASSSSVYGLNKKIPFKTQDHTDHPLAIYAASKKTNEMMSHSYSYLYNIPSTGLRFFTVYGPWGRPDMALNIFTEAILENKEFEVYNYGEMSRDFTYVEDIVESIQRLIPKAPKPNHPDFDPKNPNPAISIAPYQLFNIGNNHPVQLMDFIRSIEKVVNKKAKVIFKEMQPGDVQSTYADVQNLFDYIQFKPSTNIETGVKKFIEKHLELRKKLK